jgi:hypothetical protein
MRSVCSSQKAKEDDPKRIKTRRTVKEKPNEKKDRNRERERKRERERERER